MKINLLLCVWMGCVLPLFSQWTSDTDLNTLVANSQTGDLQSIGTADGHTYIAYWHDVPAPVNYEMRVQLLDAAGNPQFGPQGILVDNTAPMSTFTVTSSMAVDANNNVYIGFTGTGTGNPAVVHKIASDGTQSWGNAGITLGTGYDVKVLPLSSGEVVVTWLPGNQAVMQKFTADGAPIWPAPVTILPNIASHETSAGELAAYSDGDILVLVHDRGGFSPSSTPMVQRYSGTDGSPVWASMVALTSGYSTVFNRRYSTKMDDSDVFYAGYAAAQGIQPHGFLQRVDPDGSLPWGGNGVDFSSQSTLFETDVQMTFDPASDVIWAICEYTTSTQSEYGEYVQRFDKATGTRQLTDNAKELFPISADNISHRGALQVVDNLPVFAVSDGYSNGVFPKDILAVSLDANGDFAWPTHTQPIASNDAGVKSRIYTNLAVDGQMVTVWVDDRTGTLLPYAQNLQLGCALPEAGFVISADLGTVTFVNTAADVTSVLWTFGDGNSSVGDSVSHTFLQQGIYTVCQIVGNDCGADTLCKDISVVLIGTHTAEGLNSLSISPNPSAGAFEWEMTLTQAAAVSYSILNAAGKTVKTGSAFLSAGINRVPMSVDLPAGTYQMQFTVGKQTIARTIQIVR